MSVVNLRYPGRPQMWRGETSDEWVNKHAQKTPNTVLKVHHDKKVTPKNIVKEPHTYNATSRDFMSLDALTAHFNVRPWHMREGEAGSEAYLSEDLVAARSTFQKVILKQFLGIAEEDIKPEDGLCFAERIGKVEFNDGTHLSVTASAYWLGSNPPLHVELSMHHLDRNNTYLTPAASVYSTDWQQQDIGVRKVSGTRSIHPPQSEIQKLGKLLEWVDRQPSSGKTTVRH